MRTRDKSASGSGKDLEVGSVAGEEVSYQRLNRDGRGSVEIVLRDKEPGLQVECRGGDEWVDDESPSYLSTAVVSSEDASGLLVHLAGQVALGVPGASEGWRSAFLALAASHDDVRVRVDLAGNGPLGVLRRLVNDPDVRVRYAILANPLVVDAEIQLALGSDSDPRVVVGLLGRISPSAATAQAIVNGPHADARRLLATMRVGDSVNCALSEDRDLVTRMIAQRNARATGLSQGGGAPLALGPGEPSSSIPDSACEATQDVIPEPESRPMSDFQARLYAERAGLSREEAQPWWDAYVYSAEAAAAIAAGRGPVEEVDYRRGLERDKWLCSVIASSEGLSVDWPVASIEAARG